MTSGGIHKELRIVLVGKSGVGKSSLGNSLLQCPYWFQSTKSTDSVNKGCTLGMLDLDDGKSMIIVDTPGLLDTAVNNDVSKIEFVKCIGITSPGPHIFVCVLSLIHFTPEELEPIQYLKRIFGDRFMDFVIVVFTGKNGNDQDIKKYISNRKVLSKFVWKQCKGRYTTICNKVKSSSHKNDVQSVINLIRRTTRNNDNTYYTEKMFQEAESAIIKEIHKRQRTETALNEHTIRRKIRRELHEHNKYSPSTGIWEALTAINSIMSLILLPVTVPIAAGTALYKYFTGK